MAVTEEGNICLFIKSYLRTLRLSEETSHAEKRKLFVKIFSLPLQHLKDNKQKSLCFARKFVCSWKLAVFLKLRFPGICSHLGTDNDSRQISVCIFSRQIEATVYIVRVTLHENVTRQLSRS